MNVRHSYDDMRSATVGYAREYLPTALARDYVAQLAAWKTIAGLFDGTLPTLSAAQACYGDAVVLPGQDWSATRAAKGLVRELAARARAASRLCEEAMGMPSSSPLPDGRGQASAGLCSVELDPYDISRVIVGVDTPAVRISASPQVDPDIGYGLGIYAVTDQDDPLEEPRIASLVEHDMTSAVVRTLAWDEAGDATEAVNLPSLPCAGGETPDAALARGLPAEVAELLDSESVHGMRTYPTPVGGHIVEVALEDGPLPDCVAFDFSKHPEDAYSVKGWLRRAVTADGCSPPARAFLERMAELAVEQERGRGQ